MTPEQFFILNFILLVGFAGLFFWGRRGTKPPSRLNLTSVNHSQKVQEKKSVLPKGGGAETLGELHSTNLKDINPMFIYNGHAWDAYEVLGIIPGSSMEVIRESFDRSIQKSDVSSHEFLKVALTTILCEMRNQGYKV